MSSACSVRVRGSVQGVGFRPFVYRLARANTLVGWVSNDHDGVEIHVEGTAECVEQFLRELRTQAPAAAAIATVDVGPAQPSGLEDFTIRASTNGGEPTVRITPDLAVCVKCEHELLDLANRRHRYPYINCTNCGPRYSIIRALPYDRPNTTMSRWPVDAACAAEYHDPGDRRFHAQPVACGSCGPQVRLRMGGATAGVGHAAVVAAANALSLGSILAIKGIGGYHLCCDARNAESVASLRTRKFRKEKPFALLCRDREVADEIGVIAPEAARLLMSQARPIVVVPARVQLFDVAPGSVEVGLMLPYTPLQILLFQAGAPNVLVMTSGNRSSEPIAYEDDVAVEKLAGLADGFLIGERPIARRIEDSVVRVGTLGSIMIRRSRGYAPAAVAEIPSTRPILALGADLKNAITLVVDGQAFVSQHIGDLDDYESHRAFDETVRDLLEMYHVRRRDLVIAHDRHPQYRSTQYAEKMECAAHIAVQHHRAHIASVLAERGEWGRRVLGLVLDGTGYGDDGTIWGCELFLGAVASGFDRVAHLRSAALPGGDAAARHPVQAAAGFLSQIEGLPQLGGEPFNFPSRHDEAAHLLRTGTRVFQTSSAGRLFDAAAALLGFVVPVTFEGQAATWLEQQARKSGSVDPYPFPFHDAELDFRPLLAAIVADRVAGRDTAEIARAFHTGIAQGLAIASVTLCRLHDVDTVVVSGGTFQNAFLLEQLHALLADRGLALWANRAVPPNDGGISLGQAALAAHVVRANSVPPSRTAAPTGDSAWPM